MPDSNKTNIKLNTYTLFIADEDSVVRDCIKRLIISNEAGFTLCGEYKRSDTVLSDILDACPDLVILDINMGEMIGTDIINQVRTAGWQGKVIILSEHCDFKYAQAAINAGVSSYLTKPLNKDELISALGIVYEQISEQKKHAAIFKSLWSDARDIIIGKLLNNVYDTMPNEEKIRYFNLHSDVYQVVICEDYHKHSSAVSYSFADFLKVSNNEISEFEHLMVKNNDIVLLRGQHSLHQLKEFLNYYEKRPIMEGSPMESMFLAFGRPVNDIRDIHLSYEDASTLLRRRFFFPAEQHSLSYKMLPPAYNEKSASPPPKPRFFILFNRNRFRICSKICGLYPGLQPRYDCRHAV